MRTIITLALFVLTFSVNAQTNSIQDKITRTITLWANQSEDFEANIKAFTSLPGIKIINVDIDPDVAIIKYKVTAAHKEHNYRMSGSGNVCNICGKKEPAKK